ncbi:hypothetical protein [Ramlibacter sp.]|uniref:hypothetical protein n=1 Tax=Ramlibacter sp. TaxID=1917967 RepID=UPI003D12B5C9
MSFLNQLKSQANALQSQRSQQDVLLEDNIQHVELACRQVLAYLQDLARQLNVIEPPSAPFTLDGKTPWPAMKLRDFRTDFRRKQLRDREVFDYLGMGWQAIPQMGRAVGGLVTVNFPPDQQRVESRIALGMVKHERKESRHPEKNTLLAIRYEYQTETRGNVTVSADHEKGMLNFRLVNTDGFEVQNVPWPAAKITTALLDELAKRIVGQPSKFV